MKNVKEENTTGSQIAGTDSADETHPKARNLFSKIIKRAVLEKRKKNV